jgi:hypothetical protein
MLEKTRRSQNPIGKSSLPTGVTGGVPTVMPVYINNIKDATYSITGAVNDVGPLTTDFDTNLTSIVNNFYRGMVMRFTSGALAGQANIIESYTGATKNCAFHGSTGIDCWTSAPANGDTFIILSLPFYKFIYGIWNNTALLSELHDKSRQKLSPVASAIIEEISVVNVAADIALGSIVVNTIPAGATPTFVQLIFVCRVIENTNVAANKLNGAQDIQIQKGAGAWADAINFVDNAFGIAASTREGGLAVYGTINLAATVTGNDTYNIQWDEASSDVDALNFNDCQLLLYIEYSI